jgi:hypothetical protein
MDESVNNSAAVANGNVAAESALVPRVSTVVPFRLPDCGGATQLILVTNGYVSEFFCLLEAMIQK